MLRSALLGEFAWIDHGFGTRLDDYCVNGGATLRQIHSARVIAVNEGGCAGEGDALITDRAGLSISVRTADCLPILIADTRTRLVAAVHAGWRGTAARIAAAAVERMRNEFGSRAQDLIAAIGPGIGVCCYEVGAEVAQQFGLEQAGRVDLASANRVQLIESAVPERHIEVLGLCTFCDPGRFHSYRRDKQSAGRMVSYIRTV